MHHAEENEQSKCSSAERMRRPSLQKLRGALQNSTEGLPRVKECAKVKRKSNRNYTSKFAMSETRHIKLYMK